MAQPDGQGAQTDDWRSWDWRQIQSALFGSSFSSDVGADGKQGWATLGVVRDYVSNPQSFFNAAWKFQSLRAELAHLRDALRAQRPSRSGSWEGEGADAAEARFSTLERAIDGYEKPLADYVRVLNSVGVGLQNAIASMYAAHRWAHAVMVALDPSGRNTFQVDGYGRKYIIKAFPTVEAEMTRRAREIMDRLASDYRRAILDLPLPQATPPSLPAAPDPPEQPQFDPSSLAGPSTVDMPPLPAGLDGSGLAPTATDAAMPTGLDSPALPSLSDMPPLGDLPSAAGMPSLSDAPSAGGIPSLGEMPSLPGSAAGGSPLPMVPGLTPLPPNTPSAGSTPRTSPPLPGVTPLPPMLSPGSGGGPSPQLPGVVPPVGGGSGPTIPTGSHTPISPAVRPPVAGTGLGYGGMPYLPPMIPPMAGAGAGRENERERTTWLQEDRRIWDTLGVVAPSVITGPVEASWDDSEADAAAPRANRADVPGRTPTHHQATTQGGRP